MSLHPLLLALVVLAPAWSRADEPALDPELRRQQGTWRVVTSEREGKPAPEEVARSITRKVEGDHVVWERDGKPFAGTTIEVAPKADPPAIDVIPDGGRLRGERVLGIYKIEGEVLTICMADPGRPRPRSFISAEGDRTTLMTFRRVEP